MKMLAALVVAFMAGTPPQDTRNLVRNGDASAALADWRVRGAAPIEGTGAAAHFVVRNQGGLTQTIDFPSSSTGQFVAVVGRGASDRVNPDGSITGLPSLYGLFGDASGRRFLGYLQGQRMRAQPPGVGAWVVMSGAFRIPDGTVRLVLHLQQASRRGDPQNGSAARFDDVGVYVFPTEAQARALIADWPESEGYKVARPCSRRAPERISGVWRPDPAVIARVERELAPLVQGALERGPFLRAPTWSSGSYYRQYVGIVIDGRRIVYVNGFVPIPGPSGMPASWELQLVNACDGGGRYFGAEFDVETGRVQNLAFNSQSMENVSSGLRSLSLQVPAGSEVSQPGRLKPALTPGAARRLD